MDIAALQERLRAFAAERGWAPFHTPKNLATALLVEAAELVEIFQWKTPEQSLDVSGDAIDRETVGDEAADVLLYLAQLADATGIDLEACLERKLAKNALKHPPTAPGAPASARRGPERKVHVLVDWENVQPKENDVRALVDGATDLWLFHGPTQRNVAEHHAGFGVRATPVRISRTGKNALDFHLAFYMGYIAARHPDARFVVLSNDNGYKPMLEHAAELGFDTVSVGFRRGRAAPQAGAGTTARRAPARRTAKTASASADGAPVKKAAKAAKVGHPDTGEDGGQDGGEDGGEEGDARCVGSGLEAGRAQGEARGRG
jgi:NTP pyrophosphatase (non-canonical NTP hydrolase)